MVYKHALVSAFCIYAQRGEDAAKSGGWRPCISHGNYIVDHGKYEGCSNMNASSCITFFTYMLRQNVVPFWKELFVAFKMAPNIKKHSLFSRVTDPYIKAAPVY